MRNEDAKVVNLKRQRAEAKDKIDATKLRLRKRAIEAYRLVEQAREIGDFEKAD